MASNFIPRVSFPVLDSLPRSYFLGHHKAGLAKMKSKLAGVDLIIECRDYRAPLTSHNPLLEETLAIGRRRAIVFTKRDLGSNEQPADYQVFPPNAHLLRHRSSYFMQRDAILRRWHNSSQVFFCDHRKRQDVLKIIKYLKELGGEKLTGAQAIIVGIPNVGKSSLINALRAIGMNKGKAAQTGGQPGVTRSISTSVQVVGGVYLLDSPGVFMPYVPNQEAMLKLALCGCVKDSIISSYILADYLLFRLNHFWPTIYEQYHEPTNDITALLEAVARRTGRLLKGGIPDVEAAASWLIQRWRDGELGKFVLDEVTNDSLQDESSEKESLMSLNQARKEGKRLLKQKRSLNGA